MTKFARVLESLRDGSFVIRVANRLSRVKYVPAAGVAIDRYVVQHYPGNGWKSLSPGARKAWAQFSPVFDTYKVHTIVYAGAHTGAIALALDEAFPGREFCLIEPVPSVFQKLVENVSNHPGMQCVNVAAGAEEGWCDMFVDGFSPASSLLPYEPAALEEFPFLGEQITVRVQVKPLDDILQESGFGDVDLVVMDVQGYEDRVLEGARRTVDSCKVLISELSLQALYVGSSTFDSVYQALVREGFRFRYLVNPMEGTSHQILQMDGVFVRE